MIDINLLKPAFASSMKTLLGEDYERFIRALQGNAPTSIRLNPAKKFTDHANPSVPWCTSGRYLVERPVFTLDPVLHAGAYYVQEASSMFLEQVVRQSVDLNQSLHVLDLCAAPGGKSTHLLSVLNNKSLLISNDVIRARASVLSENITKWGHSNVIVTNNDPHDFQRMSGFFDLIVVDAPCSGEGLFRKEPEAMQEWSPENVDLCWKRQRRIVSDIWPALKPGGTLIYCTCTYNALENEENLKWMKQQFDAEFLFIKTEPLWGVADAKENGIAGYHFYPHNVNGEGFFISAIRKNTTDHRAPRIKLKEKIFQLPSKKQQDALAGWITNLDENLFLIWRENVLLAPAEKLTEIEFISQNLHIISAGTTVAEIKHEKLVPDHAFAVSVAINQTHFNKIELTKEQALQYLRKEVFQVPAGNKGFALMSYHDIPLGWANILDTRINNMYPAHWRIRMAG